jgi:phage recombination protein Bet
MATDKKETAKQELAIVTRPHASPLIMLGQRFNIEPNKLMEVMRGTVIKPDSSGRQATNEEIAAFCIVANQYDLNPFTREIYAFSSAQKGVTAIVPIDGWCKIVNRHKNAAGELDFDGCEFEEIDGPDGKPDRITCKMHVKGREHPVSATERFSECKRGTGPWGQHPYRMLRHKAYMQAARYAFGLGGIHDEDEARDITGEVTVTRMPVSMPVEIPEATTTPPKADKPATGKPEGNKGVSEASAEPTVIEKIGIFWQEAGLSEGKLVALLRKDKLLGEFDGLDNLEPNKAAEVLEKIRVYASRASKAK